MNAKEKAKVKKDIVKFLQGQGSYSPEIDDLLINEIIYNCELITTAKADIAKRGQLTNVSKPGNANPYMQLNNSIPIYQTALDKVMRILKQLNRGKDVEEKESSLTSLQKLLQ